MRFHKGYGVKKNAGIIACLLLSAILVGPFVALSFFACPAVDDYSCAAGIMRIGYIGAQADAYTHWNGRFFSNALGSIHPLLFHSIFLYRMICLSAIIALFAAIFFFVKYVLATEIRMPAQAAIAAAFFVLYLYGAPSICESFYWLPAVATYQCALVLMLLIAGAIHRLGQRRANSSIVIPACCLGALCIAGSNETVAFSFLCLSAAVFIYTLLRTRKPDWAVLSITLMSLVGLALVYLAPGNAVRSSELRHEPDLISALFLSASLLGRYVRLWCADPLLLVLTVCAIPLSARLMHLDPKTSFARIHPLASTAIYLATLLAAFLPAAYVMGHEPPPRALNAVYLIFLAGWFLNARIMASRYLARTGHAIARLPRYVLVFLLIILSAALLRPNNIRTAAGDLTNGKARAFSRQVSVRCLQIMANRADSVVVDTIVTRPRSLYFGDITVDPDSWQNRPYALYFGKKAIRLKCSYKGEYVF